jgi:integrase
MSGAKVKQTPARRTPGTGSVEPLPSGRWRVRFWAADGHRKGVKETFVTREEAEAVLAAVLAEIKSGAVVCASEETLAGYGRKDLERREAEGAGGMRAIKSRFRTWIEKAPFANKAMRHISNKEIRVWVRTLTPALSRAAAQAVLSLLTTTLEQAVEAEKIPENPARGVKVKKGKARPIEPWTFLYPAEQKALLEAIPTPERWMVGFWLACGLRRGEVENLELVDVHADVEDPHIIVRWGSPGGPTKGRRVRRVDLVGLALTCAKRWLEALPGYAPHNPKGLLFPTRRGKRRGKAPKDWRTWLRAAGIARNVRPHDLRHTCASSLVAGWWGRAWRLEEVQAFLGHRYLKETEKYAHLAPDALIGAARATRGGYDPGSSAPPPAAPSAPPAAPATPAPAAASGVPQEAVSAPAPRAVPRVSHDVIPQPDLAAAWASGTKSLFNSVFTQNGEKVPLVGRLWATRGLQDELRATLAAAASGRATATELRGLAALALASPAVLGALEVLDAPESHISTVFARWVERVEKEVAATRSASEPRVRVGRGR